MGPIRTTVSLGNPKRPDLAPMQVDALVNTEALHLRIPAHVAIQSQLEEREKRDVVVADGSKHLVSSVGPIVTAFGRRSCVTGAMVLGDEVLLGAIVVRPATRDVVPNPSNSNIPASIAMDADMHGGADRRPAPRRRSWHART